MTRRTSPTLTRHLHLSTMVGETARRVERMGRAGAALERDLAVEALATGSPQIGETDPGGPSPWSLIWIVDADLGITSTRRYPDREAAAAALTERTAHV